MSGIKIGSAARIEIGIAGENGTREIVFDAAQWMEKYPVCEAAIVGVRADGVKFVAPDVKEDRRAKTIIWTPTAAETIEGEGEAQLLWMDGPYLAKKAVMVTVCHRALETDATVPDAPEPTWAQKAVEAKREAEAAAARAEAADEAVKTEKESAIAEIEEKRSGALEEIAEAKDAALAAIGEAGENVAPPIIPTEEGDVIALSDSAARPLRRLEIFGKTTQNGTPTPDAPLELESVGADGNVVVTAAGKNLFDKDNYTVSDVYVQPSGLFDHTPNRSILLPVAPSTTYSISKATATVMRVGTSVNFPVTGGACTVVAYHSVASAEPITITTGANDKWMVVQLFTNADISGEYGSVAANVASLQIEISATATAYEAYKGTSATITTANGLPGAPVTSGGNYTDANGQQWVGDSVVYDADVGTAKLKQPTVRLTGETEFKTPYKNSSEVMWRVSPVSVVKPNAGYPAGVCSKYIIAKSYDDVWKKNGYIGINVNGELLISDDSLTDAAAVTAMLTSGDFELVYLRAEPIETDLSADDLASLAALRTHYPETTIYNNDGAHMVASYVADTKNYIDRKIQSIAAAMINNI